MIITQQVDGEKAYEGMKRGGTGGFEMTHCETSADGVKELIQQFDIFFEDSRCEMIRTNPPDGRLLDQLKRFYHEAELELEHHGEARDYG